MEATYDLQSGHKLIMNCRSAVSALPNEILSGIFEMGHDSQDVHDSFETEMSAVTSHWRSVALESPRLWTRIRRAPCQQDLEPIALYLRRSKTVPIDVTIGMNYWRSEDPRDDIGPLYQLLSAHFGRCHQLRIYSRPGKNLDRLFHYLRPVSAPSIRSIHISCSFNICAFHSAEREEVGQIFTGGAPVLDSIRLDGIELQSCLPPLGSVTAIYLNGMQFYTWMPPKEWVNMISIAQSLRHLELFGEIAFEDWDASVAFEMPALQTLSMDFIGDGSATFHGFLEYITAPRLEVLMLKRSTADEATWLIRPDRLPSLHTLILWHVFNGMDGLQNVMAVLPHIRHVVFTVDPEGGEYQSFLSLLGSGHHRPIFLPHLQTIALTSEQNHIPFGDLYTMLMHRIAIDKDIQKVFVPAIHLEKARAELMVDVGIVEVEEWRAELTPGWPAWFEWPSNSLPIFPDEKMLLSA